MTSSGARSIELQGEQRVDIHPSADIELVAADATPSKTDHDPFLVAFEEPFDADNPRSVNSITSVINFSPSSTDAGHALGSGPSPT